MNKVYIIKPNEIIEDAEIEYIMETINQINLNKSLTEQIEKLNKAINYIKEAKTQKRTLKK